MSVCMGESTSVFIRRFIKLKCAYRDLRILTISRIKIYIFVSISFRNLVRSIHTTTSGSMFSEANVCALPKVVTKLLWNWRDPCFIHLRSPEQFEKNAVFVRGLWAFRRHCQKCKKQMAVDSGGGRGQSTVSTLVSKVWWAEGCKELQIILQETSYKLILIDRALFTVCP